MTLDAMYTSLGTCSQMFDVVGYCLPVSDIYACRTEMTSYFLQWHMVVHP